MGEEQELEVLEIADNRVLVLLGLEGIPVLELIGLDELQSLLSSYF